MREKESFVLVLSNLTQMHLWLCNLQFNSMHMFTLLWTCITTCKRITRLIVLCHHFFSSLGLWPSRGGSGFSRGSGRRKPFTLASRWVVWVWIDEIMALFFQTHQSVCKTETNAYCLSWTFIYLFYGSSDIFLLLSTVGSALYDPDRLYQEQPDYFLLGLRGSRCECGRSFPPALVSTRLPNNPSWDPLADVDFLLCAELLSGCFFFSFRSMLPDVVDDFKVRNPHICGHEALFYSFYVFFIKFASGVSLGISTLSLK